MTETTKAAKRWVIESSDGSVLRASNIGLILSGSEPHHYTDQKLAAKVAEDFAAMMNAHGVQVKLHVRGESVA